MIRISWNIIHAGKAENVAREKGSNYDHSSDSNQSLRLSNQEVHILQDLLPMKSMTRHVNILKHSENASAILNAIQDIRKHILSSICRCGMHFKDAKADAFHTSFQILLDALVNEAITKRLLFNTIHKSKTSALKHFFQFCRLLNAPSSGMPDPAAVHILKHMLEEDSPVVAAITNYTMLRARQAGLARNEQDSYDLSNEDRSLFKEILRLVSGLCHKIHSQTSNGYDLPSIGDFVSLILQSLIKVESSSYYDLPVLEITVDCLCHITYSKGWSMQYKGSGEQLCNSMADIFIQILRSFHVDRIGAATSFMGKGVMTKAALCLCHVAKEFQMFCGEKDWTVGWITRQPNPTADDLDGGLPWLLPLLTDRVLDIRWSGWSLATALMNGPVGAENIVNEFQVFPGGLWASAVGVILDEFESPLVRSQACKLLSSSLSTLLRSSEKEGSLDLWSSMVVQDTQSKANINGFPAFLLLLDHFHFFKKIKEHLSLQPPLQCAVSTTTALHNVSTSCSTPSNDTNQHYEQISVQVSGESDEYHSEMASVGVQSDGNQSREGNVAKTDGSSYERLLLSHADSLSQSSKDEEDKVYGLGISKQNEKQVQTKEVTLPHYCTARMKSSLFQFIFQLIRVDADTVIANLENEGIIETLIRCLDQNFVAGFISCSGNGKLNSKQVTSFIENAEASSHLLALINILFTKHAATKDTLSNDVQFLRKLISYFQIPNLLFSEFTSVHEALFSLWNESLKTLIKMCTCSQNAQATTAEREIVKEVQFFAVAWQYSKVNGKVAQNTLTLLLTLMRSIFCREGRRNEDSRILYQTLETPCLLPDARKREEGSSGMQTTNLTQGQYLIWLLLELSNTSLASGPEHKLVVSTLSSLFVVSASAKIFALENGFLESILEEVKDIHVKLNLASLQLENDNGDKRKEKVLQLELAEIFDSLRNFMHDSVDIKEAAVKSNLTVSIQRMWSWCMIDKTLKVAVLELLVTFTAGCDKAQEILCYGGTTNQKTNQEDNALFQRIMKLIVRQHKDCMAPTGKIDASTRIVFQLVTNLAASSTCRCMIWKNNLYQHFGSSQVGQSANKKQKVASKIMTALWLQLLLVVSFYVDGSQMILKVNGVLPTLIAIASEEQHRERQKALLILRNLLFFPTNKPSLVTNDLLTSCLIKSLDTRSIWTRAIVVSCFASLLHNCHKAKVTLKRTKLLGKLHLMNEEIFTGKMLSFDGKTKGYDQLKVSLQTTLKILTN
eukprot:Seg1973.3 transcript_id=Seg1973.3/GoldUCD/mRNA.D3Y31 product=Rotatin protein_id=Seg1973.3/GoldUCD/D3Y31